jgi:hypothetical protein
MVPSLVEERTCPAKAGDGTKREREITSHPLPGRGARRVDQTRRSISAQRWSADLSRVGFDSFEGVGDLLSPTASSRDMRPPGELDATRLNAALQAPSLHRRSGHESKCTSSYLIESQRPGGLGRRVSRCGGCDAAGMIGTIMGSTASVALFEADRLLVECFNRDHRHAAQLLAIRA